MNNWCHLSVDIKNLDVISAEILTAFNEMFPDQAGIKPDFIGVHSYKLAPKLPATCEFLNTLGVLDRWSCTAFITGNHGMSLPIHVDTYGDAAKNRCYGLNIPVLNCENTYTVFYKADVIDIRGMPTDDARHTARLCDEKTSVEIDRVEASNPSWINITVPHKPVMNHNLPRVNASFRFNPELHDYFN